MPLGLAKSILTTAAPAAAASGIGAFNDGAAVDGANKAAYYFDTNLNSQSVSTTGDVIVGGDSTGGEYRKISTVMWFRVNGVSNLTNGSLGWRLLNPNWFGSAEQAYFLYDTGFGYTLGMLDSGNNTYTKYGTNGTPGANDISMTDYRSNYLDGTWQCVMATLDLNATPVDTTTPGNTHIFHGDDGPGVASSSNQNFGSNFDVRAFKNMTVGHLVSQGWNGSTGSASAETFGKAGGAADIGPIWIYTGQSLDFTSQSVRRYFYDPANTDGFVDPGTDGTGGGAPQPDLFLYHNGTTLVNGGTESPADGPTVFKTGTGSINYIADTDGPGSGGTN
jgi:hypothetical protein